MTSIHEIVSTSVLPEMFPDVEIYSYTDVCYNNYSATTTATTVYTIFTIHSAGIYHLKVAGGYSTYCSQADICYDVVDSYQVAKYFEDCI